MKKDHLLTRCLATLMLLASMAAVQAQDFDKFFTDKTLRIDYTLAGDATHQTVYFDEMSSMDGWYGRRVNLSSVPVQGDGQIEVTDLATGSVIYRNMFSTLFQEWVFYDEAKTTPRSFEGVALVPMPRDSVRATIRLFDHRNQVSAEATRVINPKDILIRHRGKETANPYEYIQHATDPKHAIRIAFLAEGFTEKEMPHFVEKVREAVDAMFAHEPFASNKGAFDIVAVKAVSAQSGVSQPSKGEWLNTVVGSNFDSFYSDRYLTTLHLRDIHNALACTPYDHIIVLVNTPIYGGGGILNFYTIASTDNKWYRPVVVHEFGHAFAGLADEYAYEDDTPPMYPTDVEPWAENITTLVDYASKWKDMEGESNSCGTVATYEGAGYSLKGVYRPTPGCRMRDNNTPDFCPVCQRAIRRIIEFNTKQK